MDYAVNGVPAVQAAMLWRCHAQRDGGSGTLLQDELAARVWGRRA